MKACLRRGVALALPAVCGLAACGGGGGDDGAPSVAAALAVPDVAAGPPAAEVETEVLVANAVRHATDGLTVNLAAADVLLAGMDAGTAAAALGAIGVTPSVLAALEDRGAGDGFVAGLLGGDAESAGTFDDDAGGDASNADETAADFGSFVAHALGELGAATVLREGDRIDIDPDETALCDARYAEWYHAENDRARCRSLASELTVTIDAAAESSGIVTWRYRGEPVLRSAYAPDVADYELRLSGLASLWRAAAAFDGASDTVPPTFEGTLRLAAEVTSRAPGSEAGTMSFGVGEPLRIADPALGTRVELAPSTLWSLGADAATGDASFGVSIGAFTALIGADLGNGRATVASYSHGGVVVDARLDGASDTFSIPRFGLPGKPLTWSIDERDVLRVGLPVTGATYGRRGDELTLTERAALTIELPGTPGTEEGIALGYAAPAGTRFVERASGDVEVREGGPFVATLTVGTPDGGVERYETSVEAGRCWDGDAAPLADEVLKDIDCD